MSLEKFYQIIDKSPIGRFIEKRIDILRETNPDRIYIQYVSHFYNIPYWAAKFFCELAVKEGMFRRRIGIECPHQHGFIKSVNNESEIPETITCETCQHLEMDEFEYAKSEFKTIVYYQYIL